MLRIANCQATSAATIRSAKDKRIAMHDKILTSTLCSWWSTENQITRRRYCSFFMFSFLFWAVPAVCVCLWVHTRNGHRQ